MVSRLAADVESSRGTADGLLSSEGVEGSLLLGFGGNLNGLRCSFTCGLAGVLEFVRVRVDGFVVCEEDAGGAFFDCAESLDFFGDVVFLVCVSLADFSCGTVELSVSFESVGLADSCVWSLVDFDFGLSAVEAGFFNGAADDFGCAIVEAALLVGFCVDDGAALLGPSFGGFLFVSDMIVTQEKMEVMVQL